MDQGNAVVCAAVLQHRFLIPQRDLKLAFGFIVCNGITIHEACYSGFSLADSTPMSLRGNKLFLEILPEFGLPHNCACWIHQVSCSSRPAGLATTSVAGHEPVKHAS